MLLIVSKQLYAGFSLVRQVAPTLILLQSMKRAIPLKELFLYVKAGDVCRTQVFLDNHHDNLNLRDESGDTLITKVLSSPDIKTEFAKLALVQLLENSGVDVNLPHQFTWQTPFHIAVRMKYEKIVDFLLENQAVESIRDAFDKEPIHYIVHCDLLTRYPPHEITRDHSPVKLLQTPADIVLSEKTKQKLQEETEVISKHLSGSVTFKTLLDTFSQIEHVPWLPFLQVSETNPQSEYVRRIAEDIVAENGRTESGRTVLEKKMAEEYHALTEGLESRFSAHGISGLTNTLRLFEENTFSSNYKAERTKYLQRLGLNSLGISTGDLIRASNVLRKEASDVQVVAFYETLRKVFAMSFMNGTDPTLENFAAHPFPYRAFFRVENALVHPNALMTRGHIMDFQKGYFVGGHTYFVLPSYLNERRDPVGVLPVGVQIHSIRDYLSHLFGNRGNEHAWHHWLDAIIEFVESYETHQNDWRKCIEAFLNRTTIRNVHEMVNLWPPVVFKDILTQQPYVDPEHRQTYVDQAGNLRAEYANLVFQGFGSPDLIRFLQLLQSKDNLDARTVFWVVLSMLFRNMEEVRAGVRQDPEDFRWRRAQILLNTRDQQPLENVFEQTWPRLRTRRTSYTRELRASLTWSFDPRIMPIFRYLFSNEMNRSFDDFVGQYQSTIRDIHASDTRQRLGDLLKLNEDPPLSSQTANQPDLFRKLTYYRETEVCRSDPIALEWVYHVLLTLRGDDEFFVHRIKAAAFSIDQMWEEILKDIPEANADIPQDARRQGPANPVESDYSVQALPNDYRLPLLERFVLGDQCRNFTRQRDDFTIYNADRLILLIIGVYLGNFNHQCTVTLSYEIFQILHRTLYYVPPFDPVSRLASDVLGPDHDSVPVPIKYMLQILYNVTTGSNVDFVGTDSVVPIYLTDTYSSAQAIHSDMPSKIVGEVWTAYGVHPHAVKILECCINQWIEANDKLWLPLPGGLLGSTLLGPVPVRNGHAVAFHVLQKFYQSAFSTLLQLDYLGSCTEDMTQMDERGPVMSGVYDFVVSYHRNNVDGIGEKSLPGTSPLWFSESSFYGNRGVLLKDVGIVDSTRTVRRCPTRLNSAQVTLQRLLEQQINDIASCLNKRFTRFTRLTHVDTFLQIKSLARQMSRARTLHDFLLAEMSMLPIYDRYPINVVRQEMQLVEGNQQIKKAVDDAISEQENRGLSRQIKEDLVRLANSYESLIRSYESILLTNRLIPFLVKGDGPYEYLSPLFHSKDDYLALVKNGSHNSNNPLTLLYENELPVDPSMLGIGDLILGVIKEDIIYAALENQPSAARHALADRIIVEYLRHVLRVQVFKVVTNKYLREYSRAVEDPPRAVHDLAFRPRFRVPLESIENSFRRHFQLDDTNRIMYKLSWDYFHQAEDWEFRLPHYVYENSRIMHFIDKLEEFRGNVDGQDMTVFHHLVETSNFCVLYCYRNRNLLQDREMLLRLALKRYNVHARVAMLPRDESTDKTSSISRNIARAFYEEACKGVSSEEYDYAITRNLETEYIGFANTCFGMVSTMFTLRSGHDIRFDDFFTVNASTAVANEVLQLLYDPSSPDCILNQESGIYAEAYKGIVEFLKKSWSQPFRAILKLRFPQHATLASLETETGQEDFEVPLLSNVERDLVEAVLHGTSDNLGDVMNSVGRQLMLTMGNAENNEDKYYEDILDKMRAYFSKLATQVLTDLRSILTGVLRLVINQAFLRMTMYVLGDEEPALTNICRCDPAP